MLYYNCETQTLTEQNVSKEIEQKISAKTCFFLRATPWDRTSHRRPERAQLCGSGEASGAVHTNRKPRLRQVAVTCTKGDRTKQVNVFITFCLEWKLLYFYYRPLNAIFLSHFFNVMINSHFVTVGVMVVNLIRSNTFFNFLGSTKSTMEKPCLSLYAYSCNSDMLTTLHKEFSTIFAIFKYEK